MKRDKLNDDTVADTAQGTLSTAGGARKLSYISQRVAIFDAATRVTNDEVGLGPVHVTQRRRTNRVVFCGVSATTNVEEEDYRYKVSNGV
jgi:hypothetical protein